MTVDLSSVQCIPIATFDMTTLTGSYQPLNGSGFGSDIKILEIYNGSAAAVMISLDGVTDHLMWPSKATLVIDFQTNHQSNSAYGAGTLYGRAGQVIYGKTVADPTLLFISGYR